MPLHPQAAQFVSIIQQQSAPGWHELPPEEGRRAFEGLMDLFGSKPDVHAIKDLQLAGHVPARLYRGAASAQLPLIVYFHGGGWVLGNIETHDALCRKLALAAQCAVISVDYRLAPEAAYPQPIDDCWTATEAVFARAGELGIDPDRVSVVGDSAGANLACGVALRARDARTPQLKSQVLIYPVVQPDFETDSYSEFSSGYGLTRDSMRWFWEQYVGQSVANAPPDANLARSELRGLPPSLVITAEYDVLRDEGESLANRLQQAGVPVESKRYPGMLHGFVHLSGFFDDAQRAIDDIAAYLRS